MVIIISLEIVAKATAVGSSLKQGEHDDKEIVSDPMCNEAFTTRKAGNVFKMCI